MDLNKSASIDTDFIIVTPLSSILIGFPCHRKWVLMWQPEKNIWETHCRAIGWERPLKCKQDKEVQSKYTVRHAVNKMSQTGFTVGFRIQCCEAKYYLGL